MCICLAYLPTRMVWNTSPDCLRIRCELRSFRRSAYAHAVYRTVYLPTHTLCTTPSTCLRTRCVSGLADAAVEFDTQSPSDTAHHQSVGCSVQRTFNRSSAHHASIKSPLSLFLHLSLSLLSSSLSPSSPPSLSPPSPPSSPSSLLSPLSLSVSFLSSFLLPSSPSSPSLSLSPSPLSLSLLLTSSSPPPAASPRRSTTRATRSPLNPAPLSSSALPPRDHARVSSGAGAARSAPV
eukprot:2217006-Rhodomonas_salina.2